MKSALLVVVLLVFAGASLRADNLIVNGDFSQHPNFNHGTWGFFVNGTVPGWTATYSSDPTSAAYLEIDGPGTWPFIPDTSISLNPDGPGIDVSQVVAGLTVGDSYLLTYNYATDPQPAAADQEAEVFFGGSLVDTDYGYTTPFYDGWQTHYVRVTATSTSETLSFHEVLPNGTYSLGNQIGDVSLSSSTTEPVPEPETIMLLASGLLGLMQMRKSRRLLLSRKR